jgi:uncharacterized LabA/DUF88 family protein
MPEHNVIAYIDGFNLYYGLRDKGLKWAYWLDLPKLIRLFLKPDQKLVQTKYFTTIVSSPPDKHKRQATYIEALQTLPDLSIQYGHYLSNTVTCFKCSHTYTTYHEKKTDVNIATELIIDTFEDRYQTAFLVTADSDLSTPLQVIRSHFPAKKVILLFPPGRSSKELMRRADGYKYIAAAKLSKSLLPDQVVKPNGYTLSRPPLWK